MASVAWAPASAGVTDGQTSSVRARARTSVGSIISVRRPLGNSARPRSHRRDRIGTVLVRTDSAAKDAQIDQQPEPNDQVHEAQDLAEQIGLFLAAGHAEQ